MPQPMIQVRNLGKRYRIHHARQREDKLRNAIVEGAKNLLRGDATAGRAEEFWALKDVSFDVAEGEVLGIIGKNGAGKTTLLKILSRITEPTEGEAILRGRVASLLEVGTGFHQELTGRENIFLNGSILGMPREEIRAKFDEIVAFAEVDKFLDTPVKRYSSGMRVRLAFAVAAHLDPEILLIDEVLAVGDASFQKKCLGKMEQVARGGRTVLFVSHNMHAVQSLCFRVLVLAQGRIRSDCAPAPAIRNYLTDHGREQQELKLESVARERPSYGIRLRLLRVAVMTDNQAPCESLALGEPFNILAEFHWLEDMSGVSIVVGLDSEQGLAITTVASDEMHCYFEGKEGDIKRIMVCFPELLLNTGTFSLRIGARQYRQALDLVRHATTVRVGRHRYGTATHFKELSGLIRTKCSFHAFQDSWPEA